MVWIWVPFPHVWIAIIGFLLHSHVLDSRRAGRAEYEVLSAYLVTQMCGKKMDHGCEDFPIVIRAKSDMFSFGSTPGGLVMALGGLVPVARWVEVDYFFRNLLAPAWQPEFDLPGDYHLASEAEIEAFGVAVGKRYFPDSLGYFHLSRVGFSLDMKTAYFRFEHMYGLCGDGRRVTMRKVAGEWKVAEEDWLWVS